MPARPAPADAAPDGQHHDDVALRPADPRRLRLPQDPELQEHGLRQVAHLEQGQLQTVLRKPVRKPGQLAFAQTPQLRGPVEGVRGRAQEQVPLQGLGLVAGIRRSQHFGPGVAEQVRRLVPFRGGFPRVPERLLQRALHVGHRRERGDQAVFLRVQDAGAETVGQHREELAECGEVPLVQHAAVAVVLEALQESPVRPPRQRARQLLFDEELRLLQSLREQEGRVRGGAVEGLEAAPSARREDRKDQVSSRIFVTYVIEPFVDQFRTNVHRRFFRTKLDRKKAK